MQKQNVQAIIRWAIFAVAVLFSSTGLTQVTVQTTGTGFPEEKIKVLYDTTFRVMAEEFRLADRSSLRVPITLVLGELNEGVAGDEVTKVYVIHMERWDDAKFALAVSRIALQHLVSEDRKNKIVNEIVRRARQMVPVSVQASRVQHGESALP